MAVLEHLEPKRVFAFFEELCRIPHGSGNTEAISDYLVDFAEKRSLRCIRDAMNNVIIFKDGTPGYEESEPVIIQGHMDMVCEKAPDCTKDMKNEGLTLAVDGDTVYARGTTLGGDDGIAVAMALALLDADDLEHPSIEAVFTVDEEVGMLGAAGIDVSMLRSRRLLNIDSEDEGIFTVSCAGGSLATCMLPVRRGDYSGAALTITLEGLQGGHSGVEIHKGRGNANMLMGRVLYAVSQSTRMRLVSVDGGGKDNAIPRCCVARVIVKNGEKARAVCTEMEKVLQEEYRVTDPGVCITVADGEEAVAMDGSSTEKVICMLMNLPDGVQVMSPDIEGLVQTSLNLGILTTEDMQVTASFCVRSSIESQKQLLWERLRSMMTMLDGSVEISGDYPGWAYRQESPLRDLMIRVFTEQYGYAPQVEAIHAGLECGLFCGKLPGLDCISFGPDLKEIHTCRERMSISSVQRVWAMLVEVLRRMKK